MRITSSKRRGIVALAGLAVMVGCVQAHTFKVTPQPVAGSYSGFPMADSPKFWGIFVTQFVPSVGTCQSTVHIGIMSNWGLPCKQGSLGFNLNWQFDIEWVPSGPNDVPVAGASYPIVATLCQQTSNSNTVLVPIPVLPDKSIVFWGMTSNVYYPGEIVANAYADGTSDHLFYPMANQTPSTDSSTVSFSLNSGKYMAHYTFADLGLAQMWLSFGDATHGYATVRNVMDIIRGMKILSVDGQNVP